MGETWPDELFREHYAVDDEKRSIKARSERAKKRDAEYDAACKAVTDSPWMRWMLTGKTGKKT